MDLGNKLKDKVTDITGKIGKKDKKEKKEKKEKKHKAKDAISPGLQKLSLSGGKQI